MHKNFLVGASLALVLLMGAGCNKSAPTATNNEVPSQTPAATTETAVDTSAIDPNVPPVELTMLGLNEDKTSLRFRAKIVSPKQIKHISMFYSCIYEGGSGEPEKFNTVWENPDANGQPQQIVSGKTYEGETPPRSTVSCSELTLGDIPFTDGTEWIYPRY